MYQLDWKLSCLDAHRCRKHKEYMLYVNIINIHKLLLGIIIRKTMTIGYTAVSYWNKILYIVSDDAQK